MDALRTLRENYSTVVLVGVVLLVLACIFAFVEFSKVRAQDYTWRALCITCFIAGLITLVAIAFFAGYNRYCGGNSTSANRTLVEAGAPGFSSELELNGQ